MKTALGARTKGFWLVVASALVFGLGLQVAVCIPPAEIETEQTVKKVQRGKRNYTGKQTASRAAKAVRAAERAEAKRKEAEAKRAQWEASIAKMKKEQAEAARKKAIKDEEAKLASVGDINLELRDERGNAVPNLDLVVKPTYVDPGEDGRIAGVKTYPADGYWPDEIAVKTDGNGNVTIPKQKCYLYNYTIALASDEAKAGASDDLKNALDMPEWEVADGSEDSFSFPGFHKPITINLKLKRLKGDIEVRAPVGSKIKLGSQVIAEIPESGACRVSVLLELGGRGLKLAVLNETETAIMAGTATIPSLSPYDLTYIADVPLTLQAIKSVETAGDIDVGMSADDVETALGKPAKISDTLVAMTGQPEKKVRKGSKTWDYPAKDLSLQVREVTLSDGSKRSAVESIRITGPQGGQIAGISVGDPGEMVREVMGECRASSEGELCYLDNGIRFEKARLKVASIEIAREKQLLMEGTPAFVRPLRPRFLIANVESEDAVVGSEIRSSIRGMFDVIGPYIVVESEDDADYKVSAKLISCTSEHSSSLEERKDKKGGKYYVNMTTVTARASLSLEVEDIDTGKSLLSRTESGAVSMSKETSYYNDSDEAACRASAVRSAAFSLLDDLYEVKPVVARVTAVDYTANKVRINLGKADGLQPRSAYQRPTEFRIEVDGKPLLNNDDHYVEATEDVGEDYAVLECCSKNAFGKTKQDWTVLFQIPDPASARVVAIMKPRHGVADTEQAGGSGGGLLEKLLGN